MEIKDVAHKINDLASNYKMGNFQTIRKELKGFSRIPSFNIFTKQTIKSEDNYAFHHGGRKELQYNIGWNEEFRYGVAFSLEGSNTLRYPVETLEPKIERFNNYMNKYEDLYEDLILKVNDVINENLIIKSDQIEYGNFIFLGKYVNKYYDELEEDDYCDILTLFDRLLPLYKYVESKDFKSPKTNGNINEDFTFIPGHTKGKESIWAKYKPKKVKVKKLHNKMVSDVYNQLKVIYGENNVGTDEITKCGSIIDLVVRKNNSFTFYEFKTYQSLKLCIREAIGQLIEYSYYPDTVLADKLIVVSQNKVNENTKKYLKRLREEFDILIYYQHYNEEKGKLEKTEY